MSFADMNKTIAELPEVFTGTWAAAQEFLANLHFVREVGMMYGGYHTDDEGDCYYITPA